MGARVLLALDAGADEAAAVLRDAGFGVEQATVKRVERAVASTQPALCVVSAGGAGELPPAWAQGPEAPAWIAVADDPTQLSASLIAGTDAVLAGGQLGDLLAATARRALERRAARCEAARQEARRLRDDEWVLSGTSAAVGRLVEALTRVASTPRTTVLVRGPLGSPTAALARLVHARSARAPGPLIELWAGDVDATRWGEVLGTPASPGSAQGGSLVVHEIAHLDEHGQAALVEFFEAGGAREGELDLRLVATSTRDLALEVEAGRLREDLFYRLNVLTLTLPPLAERGEDLALLAECSAARSALELGLPARRLSPEQRVRLTQRSWAGDLRELTLYMESLLLPAGLELPARPGVPSEGPGQGLQAVESLDLGDRSLKAVEEALIRRVLDETGGNKLRAAEILGIHRTTLYHKLETYGVAR